ESFAAGTPVIASRAAAIPEIASRQGPGWDLEPGHAGQLADRMESVLTGSWKPAFDLRSVAREFDRRTQFRTWRELLIGDDRTVDAVHQRTETDHVSRQAVEAIDS